METECISPTKLGSISDSDTTGLNYLPKQEEVKDLVSLTLLRCLMHLHSDGGCDTMSSGAADGGQKG